jgi:4-aminobutyrate aminotransferase
MNWPPGVHSNTFGGNLLAPAASLASLEFLKRENTQNRVPLQKISAKDIIK